MQLLQLFDVSILFLGYRASGDIYLGLALSQPLRRFLHVRQPERVHAVPVCRVRTFFWGVIVAEFTDDVWAQPVSVTLVAKAVMVGDNQYKSTISPRIDRKCRGAALTRSGQSHAARDPYL